MKPEETIKMKTVMNSAKGARAPIERRGHHFYVETKVQAEDEKKEGQFIVPEQVATKRQNAARGMEVDKGDKQVRNK